jgi:hypothetical protein
MTSDAHANEVGKPSATVAAVAVAIPPANAGNRRFADWHEQVAANQSRGVAPEAAGILDWAPASTGLRSAQVLEKRASSDAVKTVKRETAQLGGAAAQAKAPRALVAPHRKPRATEQPERFGSANVLEGSSIPNGAGAFLPRQLPLHARLFLCDTDAQPRQTIPAAGSSRRQLAASSLPESARAILCDVLRPTFCLRP